jgi:hypothetical protein
MKNSLMKRSLGQGYPVKKNLYIDCNNKLLATAIEALSIIMFYIFFVFPFCLLENCWTRYAHHYLESLRPGVMVLDEVPDMEKMEELLMKPMGSSIYLSNRRV